jgi:hypothetical protein
MRRRWNAQVVGFAVLFALLVGGAWYSSQDDTLACVVPVGQGDGSKLNKYRICLVNGVAGIGGIRTIATKLAVQRLAYTS